MLFLRCLLPSFLLMLFSLLSCSSDSEYPYTIVKGDSYSTRLYTLPSGVKLYVARTTDQPRVEAALYMPSVASDTLGNLYSESVYSREYPMLFARIGSDVSRVIDYKGSTLVCNNIPSNELENWAVIMQGSFAAFPDSLSIVLLGDVVYDDAVATMARYFEKIPHLPSPVAASADDEKSLLANVRSSFFGNNFEAERVVSLFDICSEAKNSIKLLPSPPAKVIFSDTDELKIKKVSDGSRMVVAECNDTIFTFTLRSRLKELPSSFLALIKDYFDASLNAENDSLSPVTQVKIDKNLHTLELSVTGGNDNAQQLVTKAVQRWKSVADGGEFYKYLLANGDAVVASKDNNENIAMQAAAYIAGGKRLCGTRELARYSMDALFASSGEVFFSGKNADKIYALLPNLFSAAAPCSDDFSAAGDSLARYFLLPSDADSAVTVTLGGAYESVEDYAAIALFNKAASLSNALPSAQFYSHGALLSAGDCAPFTRDAFDAAKSFLLYDCSTYGSNAQSLLKEYAILKACGYTSSQFYDALMRLSFSDVEDFYARHKENAVTQLIIGCESSLNLREIKNNGRVVHLTSAELFGY